MVNSIGMQQVLQLASTVERAQAVQQNVSSETARSFDKEMATVAGEKLERTEETTPAESLVINQDSHGKRQGSSGNENKKDKEDEENKKNEAIDLLSEAEGLGGNINVVA